MAERQKVGREPVVLAGLKLLDEKGFEGLTLGAIAKELNVRAPTLYWRFSSKQDLVDEMATKVVADWVATLPSPVDQPTWQGQAKSFAHNFRTTLKRYRDGARLVASTTLTRPVILDPFETVLGVFDRAGIAIADSALCVNTLYTYVIGFTIEEQYIVSSDGQRDPRYELEERNERIDADTHPLMLAVGPHVFDNFDTRFERGVALILAGFEAQLNSNDDPCA